MKIKNMDAAFLKEKIDLLFYTSMIHKDYRIACKTLELILKYNLTHEKTTSPPEISWNLLKDEDIEHYIHQIKNLIKEKDPIQ
jgi:hypothetical protein